MQLIRLVLEYLRFRVVNNYGRYTFFTASDIVEDFLMWRVRWLRKRQLLMRVKSIIEEFVDLGFVRVYSRNARGKIYVITPDSPLFKLFKNGSDLDTVVNYLCNDLGLKSCEIYLCKPSL